MWRRRVSHGTCRQRLCSVLPLGGMRKRLAASSFAGPRPARHARLLPTLSAGRVRTAKGLGCRKPWTLPATAPRLSSAASHTPSNCRSCAARSLARTHARAHTHTHTHMQAHTETAKSFTTVWRKKAAGMHCAEPCPHAMSCLVLVCLRVRVCVEGCRRKGALEMRDEGWGSMAALACVGARQACPIGAARRTQVCSFRWCWPQPWLNGNSDPHPACLGHGNYGNYDQGMADAN